ncbi:hypothetical protein DFAR_1450026 [Desulfarculales bacterium]
MPRSTILGWTRLYHQGGGKLTLLSQALRGLAANDIWQSDAIQRPMLLVGDKRRKTYLFALIDDMSRLTARAEFYLYEGLATYLQALR